MRRWVRTNRACKQAPLTLPPPRTSRDPDVETLNCELKTQTQILSCNSQTLALLHPQPSAPNPKTSTLNSNPTRRQKPKPQPHAGTQGPPRRAGQAGPRGPGWCQRGHGACGVRGGERAGRRAGRAWSRAAGGAGAPGAQGLRVSLHRARDNRERPLAHLLYCLCIYCYLASTSRRRSGPRCLHLSYTLCIYC